LNSVFVHGATGNLGGLIIDELLKQNVVPADIVAGVRDVNSDPAKKLAAKGVQLRHAELDKKETLEKAYAGIETVVYVPIPGAALQRAIAGINSISASQTAKVSRFIQVSWGNGSTETVNQITPPYLFTEAFLRQSNLTWVIVRNGIWIDNYFPRMKDGLKTGSWSAVAKPDTYVPWISRPDTARAIATVVLKKQIVKRVLVFNHNVAITYAQVAEILSEVANKKIEFKPYGVEGFAAFLRTVLPEPARNNAGNVANILSSYDLAAELGEYSVSNDIYEVTGKTPEDLRDYIKRALGSAPALDMQ
jgi:NAD(P)H dehydrogenase (quinone)